MIFKITPASVSVGLSSAVMFPLEPILNTQEQEKLLFDLNQFCEPLGLVFFLHRRFFGLGENLIFARVKNSDKNLHKKLIFFKFKKSCGQPMADFLPRGEGGVILNAWMTEIQMFLHLHVINILRKDNHQGTVDILWFEKIGCLF